MVNPRWRYQKNSRNKVARQTGFWKVKKKRGRRRRQLLQTANRGRRLEDQAVPARPTLIRIRAQALGQDRVTRIQNQAQAQSLRAHESVKKGGAFPAAAAVVPLRHRVPLTQTINESNSEFACYYSRGSMYDRNVYVIASASTESRSSGVHEECNNEPIQPKHFSENQNEDHSYEYSLLMDIRANA